MPIWITERSALGEHARFLPNGTSLGVSDGITDGIVGVADRWPNSLGVGHGQRYECKRRAKEGACSRPRHASPSHCLSSVQAPEGLGPLASPREPAAAPSSMPTTLTVKVGMPSASAPYSLITTTLLPLVSQPVFHLSSINTAHGPALAAVPLTPPRVHSRLRAARFRRARSRARHRQSMA
jgi:hypothetical protein